MPMNGESVFKIHNEPSPATEGFEAWEDFHQFSQLVSYFVDPNNFQCIPNSVKRCENPFKEGFGVFSS